MAVQLHDIKILGIQKETEDCVSVTFEIPDNLKNEFAFIPGQYLTLEDTISGENVRRAYSLCSAPHEESHKVAIKQIENGVFSTHANNVLKAGDQLKVMKPMGNFTLSTNKKNKKNYVFYAAGSGITPIISMIKSVLINEPNSHVTLFYGNKGFSSIIFREDLENLKNKFIQQFRVIHVFSKESIGNPLQKGRINKEKNDSFIQTFLKHEEIDGIYLCGPETMIKEVTESFLDIGLDKQKIHFELFNTSSEKKQVNNNIEKELLFDSLVKIEIDGDSFELKMKSGGNDILTEAQKNGADLPFACKGGVCSTCKAKVIKGKVDMDINYALEEEEVNDGYILTCQAHPKSENVIISFDD